MEETMSLFYVELSWGLILMLFSVCNTGFFMSLTYWWVLCSTHMWSLWRYMVFLWNISFLRIKAGQGRLFFPVKDTLRWVSKSCLFSLYQSLSQAGDLPFCSVWKAAISSHWMIFYSLLSEGFSCVLWLLWSHWGYSLQYVAHRTSHSKATAREIKKSMYLFLSSMHE